MLEDEVRDSSVIPVLKKVRATLGDCYRDKIRRDVPILAFHRIRSGDGTSIETFRKVLDHVATSYRSITLGELAGILRGGPRIPKDAIVLTFDDATLDQYTLAAPELNKRGLCATFAVIGCTLFERSVPPLHAFLHVLEATTLPSVRFGFPPYLPERTLVLDASGKQSLRESSSPLRQAIQASEVSLGAEIVAALGDALEVPPPVVEELFMSYAQVCELQDLGHEVAGHSMYHQDINEPDEATWTRDLCICFALMNEAFGARDHSYIYPFGKERRTEIHAKVRHAGFGCAATTEAGTNLQSADPYALRRINIDSDTRVPLATIY